MDIAEQLRRDEGVRKLAYTDTVGKISIGVGRNLSDVGLSDSEIGTLLQNDIASVTATLSSQLSYYAGLGDARQGVLQNMCFNLGFAGLSGFTNMLAAVARGDWETAATEMLSSRWATQVGDRATRLAQQMRSGEWT